VSVKQNISRFAEKVNFFVVFVRTCREEFIAERLQAALDRNEYVVFVPTKDYAHKKSGTVTIKRVPLIGGYVFIATTHNIDDAIQSVLSSIQGDSSIFKLLANDNSNDCDSKSCVFRTEDRAIMAGFLDILDEDFHIHAIPAIMEDNGKIRILKNTLEPYGGEIIKVIKNNQSVVVRLAVLNRIHTWEIALEFCDGTFNETAPNKDKPIIRRISDDLKVGDSVEIVSGVMSGNVSEIVGFDGDDVIVEVEMFGEMRNVSVWSGNVKAAVKV
jgi:transcription antitermination factor NusG